MSENAGRLVDIGDLAPWLRFNPDFATDPHEIVVPGATGVTGHPSARSPSSDCTTLANFRCSGNS